MYTQNKMSVNAIINASNLDINKVSFGDIRVSKTNGSKSVPIKYNGQNFQMRIPKLQYPMGVSIKETENGTNYTMLASLRGCDSYAKERAPEEAGEIGQMYNFLKDLEEKVIKTAVEKSTSWFGRARKEDVLRDSMKTLVSPSVEKQGAEWVPNGKYPPSFRMKVPVYDGKVNMDAVDMANRPIPLTTENLETVFPKRMEARFIVSPSIYVSGQGFGVTWRISYAQVSAQAKVTAAQLFDAEEDAEEEEQEVRPTVAELLEAAAEEEPKFVAQSPSAPSETEVKAAPPAPAKASKRRVVGAAI
jgi:ferritin